MEPYTAWRKQLFSFAMCDGTVEQKTDGNITVRGKSADPEKLVMYWASNPAHKNYSFSGSGLPYPSPEQAFDRSPNVGAVKSDSEGNFEFKLKSPGAYYVGLGSLYIPPQVHIKVCGSETQDSYYTIQLGDGIPYRTLTSPSPPGKNPRNSPLFYSSNLPIRGQETILRSSGFDPTKGVPDNFWGLKPPN